MARVLVIGGTLFLGRILVEQLLQRGDDVVIMHRGKNTPFGKRVGEIHCDRNDSAAVRRALQDERFELVFDNVYDWQRGTTGEQVIATALAAANGLRRYVFMSSVAVFGEGGEFDERAALVPSDYPNPYSANKADSERALFSEHRTTGLPVTTIRPAFIFGPHNPYDREAFFWDRILADRPIIIPEDGMRTMQWVYSNDVVRTTIAAATNDVAIGHAYQLGNYPAITQIEFVELLARVAGRKANLVYIPRAVIQQAGGDLFAPPLYFGAYLDVPPITIRPDAVRDELGIELTPLEQGLRETLRWYQQQDRPQPDYSWEDRLLVAAR